MTSSVAAVAGPALDDELYDVRRDLVYSRPRWRGWLHLVCFESSLVIGTLLIATAQGARQAVAAAVYAGAVSGLFGVSALYHRGRWSARARCWLQRLDQVMILALIAGTATPVLLLCVPPPVSVTAVTVLWAVTAGAALTRLLWLTAPEQLVGALFLSLGWGAAAAVPAVWVGAGVAPAVLLIAGGVLYTIGAVCYHYRRPDPVPAAFGYHEVFHVFVSVAAACHYIAIAVFLL
jgi:hemolysin III